MKILEIPFISKPKAKTFTKWIAKYLVDENGNILEEWCELLPGSQFRWKELNKKSWKYYWDGFNTDKISFRKTIMFDDTKDETLSEQKLKKVNDYFYKNLCTVLDHDTYLTWSNPTGSDYNFRRTPYLIYGWVYNQFMFINFFKTHRKTWRLTKKFRFWTYETIYIEEYFKLFPEINNQFINFNKWLFTALESDEINEETYKIDNSSESKDYIDLILSPEFKMELKDEKQKNDLRIWKLRRIFKNRLRWIKPTDHLFWKYPEDMCEAAHIFPVSAIKKLDIKYWYMIADENNGINIPTQFHKLYDNNKIYFDEKDWKVCFTNEEYKKHLKDLFSQNEYKIITHLLNSKRQNYIKMYNEKYL